MLTLSAKIRKDVGKKVKILREKGLIPAVLYGPKTKNLSLEISAKEFEKAYKAAGKSSLITLAISDEIGRPERKKFLVLIHDVEKESLTGNPIHIDFYQPRLDEEIEAKIPLVFEGDSFAIKDLGGTLIKNIQEVIVKALPQNLPHEIKVNIEKLKTLQDSILIKDLILPQGVKALKDPEEIIAIVSLPEKVEEELVKPIEEKVEEVKIVGQKPEKEEEKEEVKEGTIKKKEK